jgi:hypothetical protein
MDRTSINKKPRLKKTLTRKNVDSKERRLEKNVDLKKHQLEKTSTPQNVNSKKLRPKETLNGKTSTSAQQVEEKICRIYTLENWIF